MIYAQIIIGVAFCLVVAFVYGFGFSNTKITKENDRWSKWREWPWWLYCAQAAILLWVVAMTIVYCIIG